MSKKESIYNYMSIRIQISLTHGVIDTDKNDTITAWREKPEITSNINTGYYIMEPGVFPLIPNNVPYGMDNLSQISIDL